MADPKTKDEDQNAIPPETDWPKPNIWPPRQWPVGLKQLISNFLYVVIAISVLILVPTIIFGCFYLLGDIISLYTKTDDPDQFTKLRNSLLILAAMIGAPFLVWRTMLAAEQTKTAEKQAQIAQEKAYTELFTQAIEQLGSEKPETTSIKDKNGELIVDEAGRPLTEEKYVPNIEVRVGAIYALSRIMKDSDKDAPAIIDTLATYVRRNCGEPEPFEFQIPEEKEFKTTLKWLAAIKQAVEEIKVEAHKFKEKAPANREDIQTALKIIGNRPPKYKTKENMPDLSKANFQGANFSNFDLSYCNLTNADMQGIVMQETKLQMSLMTEVKLQGAMLYGAKMQETKINGAHLQGALLINSNFQGAIMHGARMHGVELYMAQMQKAIMHNAEMQGAKLQGAGIQAAEFLGAKLQGAQMQGANVACADLQWAEIDHVNITELEKLAASVLGVNFTKADYDLGKLPLQLSRIFGHKSLTILPHSIITPAHWSDVDMSSKEGDKKYEREWNDFKEKMLSKSYPRPPWA